MKKIIVLTGQTATGKTDVALRLAKKHNGELVSFDSRQAYKNLDIITGKDFDLETKKEKEIVVDGKKQALVVYEKDTIPVWLYDIFDPKEIINLSRYFLLAHAVIDDIVARGKVPIIVGGTVFYIRSFLEGVDSLLVPPNNNLRESLEKLSTEDLQEKLSALNNEKFIAMNHSDGLNPRRLIRAIEIEEYKKQNAQIPTMFISYDYLLIALIASKEKLFERIEKRVESRLDEGAINEMKGLLKKYVFEDPGLNSNGYIHLKEYIKGEQPLSKAIEHWVRGELDHARRQNIYLKKMRDIHVFDPDDAHLVEKIDELIYKFL